MLDIASVSLPEMRTPLILLSRTIIALAWAYALVGIWKHRELPHANQALAGALAMVLSNALILFDVGLPYDIILFFVSMSQLVLAISFTRLFGLMKDFSISPPAGLEIDVAAREVSIMYLKGLVSLTVVSIAGLIFQYIVTQF